MRHKIAGNRLGRNSKWREATVRDIAKATLIQQRVKTTEAKAREARKLVDRLITLGKKGTLAHKRRAFSILCDHKLVSELFKTIAVRFGQRNGGYTRLIKLATNRRGDNAKLVFLELTEQEHLPVTSGKKDKKTVSKKVAGDVSAEEGAGGKALNPVKDDSKEKQAEPKEEKKEKDKGGGFRGIFRRKKEK